MLATIAGALVAFQVIAQIPSVRSSTAPLPNGQRIHAKDGDVIVVDRGARVRLVRLNEGAVRAIYNADHHWLVLLVDWADENGRQPDGMVDSAYSFQEISGTWPLGERWEGSAIIEEYSLAGEGGRTGIGIRTAAGVIQLLTPAPMPRGADVLADPSAVAQLTYRGASAGGVGGRSTFDAAEEREVAQAEARATGQRPVLLPGAMAPVRVGGAIRQPRKLADVRPVYPAEAQAARVTGVVIVEAVIGTDGSVTDARILRSIPLLDKPAIEAVRQWKFEPTLLEGVAVPVIMTVTVNFSLQEK